MEDYSDLNMDTLTVTFPTAEKLTLQLTCVRPKSEIEAFKTKLSQVCRMEHFKNKMGQPPPSDPEELQYHEEDKKELKKLQDLLGENTTEKDRKNRSGICCDHTF